MTPVLRATNAVPSGAKATAVASEMLPIAFTSAKPVGSVESVAEVRAVVCGVLGRGRDRALGGHLLVRVGGVVVLLRLAGERVHRVEPDDGRRAALAESGGGRRHDQHTCDERECHRQARSTPRAAHAICAPRARSRSSEGTHPAALRALSADSGVAGTVVP